jgi:hypothetical protein
MPRPKQGYTNAAGEKVPGTNDITGRYGDKGALIHWAHKQGQAGLPLYERSALDIGSAVHKMAELDLIGASDREIETSLHNYLSAPNHLEMANTSFRAFREWREQCRVRVIQQEISLVSERYQYGGTPDLIALVNNSVGILDFKTGKTVYPEMKIALAAHANLWNEANPKMTIDTYHLIVLPKDGGAFQHHAYDDLGQEWRLFQLFREAYSLEQSTKNVNKSAARIKSAVSIDNPPNPKVKPRIRVKMQTTPQPTMAEMLRAYGHIPGAAA